MYPLLARLPLRADLPPKGSAPRPPDDTRSACRYSRSLAFCEKSVALALRAPSMPQYHAEGGRRAALNSRKPEDSADGNAARPSDRPPSSLCSRLRWPKSVSTLFWNRAKMLTEPIVSLLQQRDLYIQSQHFGCVFIQQFLSHFRPEGAAELMHTGKRGKRIR